MQVSRRKIQGPRGLAPRTAEGFTLAELLVVIAVVSILAALLMPALARAKDKSRQVSCLSNLRQIGIGFSLYLAEQSDRFPDRRDLKASLGYKPWTTWPPSDPRGGWAAIILSNVLRDANWICPQLTVSPLRTVVQNIQSLRPADDSSPIVTYWLWRFDRTNDPVPLDNFWGKTLEQSVVDLRAADNPAAGKPGGPSEVELAVDPYFPDTVPSLAPELKGKALHRGGRNRVCLDNHADFVRDKRVR